MGGFKYQRGRICFCFLVRTVKTNPEAVQHCTLLEKEKHNTKAGNLRHSPHKLLTQIFCGDGVQHAIAARFNEKD